ncbi:hypothetical protein [Clostridium sp. DL1XJH146]
MDNVRENQIIVTQKDKDTNTSENSNNELGSLEQAMRLIDNSGSQNMLAIQKKRMTDSELKGLELELSKLHNSGLIEGISLTTLANNIVYVAYYNVINPTSEELNVDTLSVKEYKFSDYGSFEYSFWVDSESGKIYEVTLIDDNLDFALFNIDYMNGVREYYGIDNISPLELKEDNHIKQFQISIDDYQTTSYYSEFSIYNPSTGSFVTNNNGINWSVFSTSLTENTVIPLKETNAFKGIHVAILYTMMRVDNKA